MPTAFEKVAKSRAATTEAIKTYALAKRHLHAIRSGIRPDPAETFAASQDFRDAERRMDEAIQNEVHAIIEAENS